MNRWAIVGCPCGTKTFQTWDKSNRNSFACWSAWCEFIWPQRTHRPQRSPTLLSDLLCDLCVLCGSLTIELPELPFGLLAVSVGVPTLVGWALDTWRLKAGHQRGPIETKSSPVGTIDNSQAIYRWDFNNDACMESRRDGRRELRSGVDCDAWSGERSFVPAGLGRLFRALYPPMNRWAIVGCPCGTKALAPHVV